MINFIPTAKMNFSQRALLLTKKIPKGKVTTYKIIAKKLGTKAYRAVGTALRKNKTPIIIPCHRVINSDGTTGAYKGKRNSNEKIKLLKKEGIEIRDNKIKNFKKKQFKF